MSDQREDVECPVDHAGCHDQEVCDCWCEVHDCQIVDCPTYQLVSAWIAERDATIARLTAERDQARAEVERWKSEPYQVAGVVADISARSGASAAEVAWALSAHWDPLREARATIAKVRALAEEWAREERDWGIRCTEAGRQLLALLDGTDG